MTAFFFFTYRTQNNIGHYMGKFEYQKKDDLQKEFFNWISESKTHLESKYKCELAITSVNLIK